MAEYYFRARSDHASTPTALGKDRQEQKEGRVIKPKVFTSSAPGGAVPDKKCAQCEKPHLTRECRQFRESSVESRAQVVKDKKLFFKCLEPWHAISGCKLDKRCGQDGCKSGHHPFMHGAPRVSPSAMKKEKSEEHGDDKAVMWKDSKPPFNGMNVFPVKQKLTLLPIGPVTIRSLDKNLFRLMPCWTLPVKSRCCVRMPGNLSALLDQNSWWKLVHGTRKTQNSNRVWYHSA
jgi:hypothetical protein